MKCVICKGEVVEKAKVEEEIRIGNDIIFVPIEVLVCKSCGEKYYDRFTLQKLEKTEKQLKKNRSRLRPIGTVLQA